MGLRLLASSVVRTSGAATEPGAWMNRTVSDRDSTPKAAATEEQLKAILNKARDAHDVLSWKRSEECELAS